MIPDYYACNMSQLLLIFPQIYNYGTYCGKLQKETTPLQKKIAKLCRFSFKFVKIIWIIKIIITITFIFSYNSELKAWHSKIIIFDNETFTLQLFKIKVENIFYIEKYYYYFDYKLGKIPARKIRNYTEDYSRLFLESVFLWACL